jgi:hypothetical protein
MRKLLSLLTAYAVWLSKLFDVSPESVARDRRKETPTPSGRISAN